jgi:hypothetical protein
MQVLDLFSGTRAVGSVCDELGLYCWSVDSNPKLPSNHCCDILSWEPSQLHFVPDFVWLSPPCTSWSQAQHCHRYSTKDLTPLTETAVLGEKLIQKCLEIIAYYHANHPATRFVLENPRGLLRHHPPMRTLHRKTVYLCSYGASWKKPTDMWTDLVEWQPTGSTCSHVGPHPRPRSIKAKKFGAMPPALVREVLAAAQVATHSAPRRSAR